jgi:hypothetical protein
MTLFAWARQPPFLKLPAAVRPDRGDPEQLGGSQDLQSLVPPDGDRLPVAVPPVEGSGWCGHQGG